LAQACARLAGWPGGAMGVCACQCHPWGEAQASSEVKVISDHPGIATGNECVVESRQQEQKGRDEEEEWIPKLRCDAGTEGVLDRNPRALASLASSSSQSPRFLRLAPSSTASVPVEPRKSSMLKEEGLEQADGMIPRSTDARYTHESNCTNTPTQKGSRGVQFDQVLDEELEVWHPDISKSVKLWRSAFKRIAGMRRDRGDRATKDIGGKDMSNDGTSSTSPEVLSMPAKSTLGSVRRRMKKLTWKATSSPLYPHPGADNATLVNRRVKAKPSGNTNRPGDYKWLEGVLRALAKNQANSLGSVDMLTGKCYTPLFFVIGSCPNYFAGMQAVVYCVSTDGEVDFWWVKPSKTANSDGATEVEHKTLSRHCKGQYKNDPGASRKFYKPLADYFDCEVKGGTPPPCGVTFGIEMVRPFSMSEESMDVVMSPSKTVRGAKRAFIDQNMKGGQVQRLYINMVWQEDWTSNPLSSSKYIKGKIVYQKDPETLKFFSRQYNILNGSFTILDDEDASYDTILPRDDVKDLYEYPA